VNKRIQNLYIRFNYTEEKGFICNLPTLEEGIHLTIGFCNKRKEFNIHFTNDNIKESGKDRRDFILTISSFRFFLFSKRFEPFLINKFINLLQSSKINIGRLKKHKLIVNTMITNEYTENHILRKTKKGKRWRFNKNFKPEKLIDGLEYIESKDQFKNEINVVSKLSNGYIRTQGFVFKISEHSSLYFVPMKKMNRFIRYMAISIYNYLNTYPTKENEKIRKMMYERLKHPYVNEN